MVSSLEQVIKTDRHVGVTLCQHFPRKSGQLRQPLHIEYAIEQHSEFSAVYHVSFLFATFRTVLFRAKHMLATMIK